MSAIQQRRCPCCGLRSTTTLPRFAAMHRCRRGSPSCKRHHRCTGGWRRCCRRWQRWKLKTRARRCWRSGRPCLPERLFLFNKLLTGGFRIGVGRGLVVKAIASGFAIDEALVLERLMAPAEASSIWFQQLTAPADAERDNRGPVPYPFFLASPLQQASLSETPAMDWWVEPKWDGIRGQLIQRESGTYLWRSRRGADQRPVPRTDCDGRGTSPRHRARW